MRKYLFFVGAAAMMLASCTSEGVVNPGETPAAAKDAIGFSIRKANQSRAAVAPDKGLQEETYAFGVSAFKGADMAGLTINQTGEGANTVMWNYFVGYTNWEEGVTDWEGYKPEANQDVTTGWYYENLTKNGGYTWNTNKGMTEYTPTRDEQYLKYWDLGQTMTYFFGYTPYTSTPTIAKDGNNVTMSWANIETEGFGAANMYAWTKCVNADYAGNSPTKTTVDMDFKYFMSQIRLAFYNAIPGYDVELIAYNEDNEAVVAVPVDYTDPSTYNEGGEYATGLDLMKVTLHDDGTADEVTPGNATVSTDRILFDVDKFFDTDGNATDDLGNDYAGRILSQKFNVAPSQSNCGFTINVSFKLTAKDTKEVLYIRGARVFIAPTFTKWSPNTLYTYVFRLQTTSPGSTSNDDPAVSPEPNNNQALYPIIFDKITVTEMGPWEKEWDINPGLEPGNHTYEDHN